MAGVRLTKLQNTLLSAAAKRETGSILRFGDELSDRDKAVAKAISQLLRQGLISEVASEAEGEAWRTEGAQKYGLVITSTGRAAIGDHEIPASMPNELKQHKILPTCSGFTGSPPPLIKSKMVIDLLWREQGATIGEISAATGWQPHTTRAALTGLRKRGTSSSKASATTRPATRSSQTQHEQAR